MGFNPFLTSRFQQTSLPVISHPHPSSHIHPQHPLALISHHHHPFRPYFSQPPLGPYFLPPPFNLISLSFSPTPYSSTKPTRFSFLSTLIPSHHIVSQFPQFHSSSDKCFKSFESDIPPLYIWKVTSSPELAPLS